MFGRGFRYGMLLQLAVGPVCMLVFRTAGSIGLVRTLPQILGVALVDAAFLAIASAGAIALLRRERVQSIARIVSAVVLFLFGAMMILDVFGLTILPGIDVSESLRTQSVFWQGVLLTASNPMTVLFWNSLLTSQTARSPMGRRSMAAFSAGCVASTLAFLILIAIVGTFVERFLPAVVTQTITVVVGAGMVLYGVKTLVQKKPAVAVAEYAKD
jgi:threonine/homoserine/homoserine lactone efflux protein